MNEYVIAIVAGLVVAVIAAAAIWIFYMKYKKDREMWKQIAEDSYNRGKDEASEIVRSTCDQIEEDKAKLAELSDRKLLIDIMLALGSYGRRLDRIDAKLKCIKNYKAYIDDMTTLTHNLSQRFTVLEDYISRTAAVTDSLRQTISETSDNIHMLINDLGDLKALHTKINGHVYELRCVTTTLETMQERISKVVEDMNTVMEVCNQSPMAKLRSIETEIEALAEVVDMIRAELNSVSSTPGEIKSAIDDSMEEYSYGSLFYRIAAVASDVSGAKSMISDIESSLSSVSSELESVSSELGDVKSAVQNSSSSSDYYSLSSKLDDIASNMSYIQSSISSIEYKVGS